MFKLTGTVKVVNSTVQVSEKFSKREFVVTESTGMYPQDVLFQATQDKCALLDAVHPGDQVEVSFNLKGREWTSPQGEVKYFNTLEAWRIEKAGQAAPQGMAQGGHSAMNLDPIPAAAPAAAMESESDDDLPF
jgi:single-stranded DNA-binding protein